MHTHTHTRTHTHAHTHAHAHTHSHAHETQCLLKRVCLRGYKDSLSMSTVKQRASFNCSKIDIFFDFSFHPRVESNDCVGWIFKNLIQVRRCTPDRLCWWLSGFVGRGEIQVPARCLDPARAGSPDPQAHTHTHTHTHTPRSQRTENGYHA